MDCELRDQLRKRLNEAIAAHGAAVWQMTGLPDDADFTAARSEATKTFEEVQTCRSALREHNRTHGCASLPKASKSVGR